jgi:hypothetical protein
VPVAWNDDPAGYEPQIHANVRDLLTDLAAVADQRDPFRISMPQEWHRRIYDHIPLPVDYYAGGFRDSDSGHPELYGYEVMVGPYPGVPSVAVPAALTQFEGQAQAAIASLDRTIPVGGGPADAPQLSAVISLCGLLHGEWVRIHPFANGNGRVARTLANWAALRYGLPPFVTIKPRPGQPYGMAAMQSMAGQHQLTIALFHQMLVHHLQGSP